MDSIKCFFDTLSRSNVGNIWKNNRIKGGLWVSHLSFTLNRVAHSTCTNTNTHTYEYTQTHTHT